MMFERLAEAFALAAQSPDPSTKVGAVIVSWDNVQGTGYNQFPPGIPEYWWNDRTLKYRAVVHAEAVALLKAGQSARNSVMYVTHHPCPDCAKLIAQAGVKMVCCPAEPWRNDGDIAELCYQAREIMDMAGISVIHHTNGVID